jgi:Tfp pilus assembly protein PilF
LAAYFERAIQKDPNYALAYAGLANSYIFLSQPGVGDAPKEALPQAKAAATKALAIDDSLGEAHSALAHVIELYDWDWQGAEREYRRPWNSTQMTHWPTIGMVNTCKQWDEMRRALHRCDKQCSSIR